LGVWLLVFGRRVDSDFKVLRLKKVQGKKKRATAAGES